MPTNLDLAGSDPLTVPSLTADTDDLGPNGGARAATWYLSSSQAVTVTGIATGTANRSLTLVNTGSYVITLKSRSTSSLDVNRLYLVGDFTIAPGRSVVLAYSGTLSGWTRPGARARDGSAAWSVVDEFIFNGAEPGEIGDLGWMYGNGSAAAVVGIAGAPGMIERISGTTANQIAYMAPATSALTAMTMGDIDEVFWTVALTTTGSDFTIRFGFAGNAASDPPTDGVYVERLAADTAWYGVTRASSSQTRSAISSGFDTSFHTFLIRLSASRVTFQMGSAGTATDITATIPAASVAMMPFVQVIPTTTTARSLYIDRVAIYGVALPGRW